MTLAQFDSSSLRKKVLKPAAKRPKSLMVRASSDRDGFVAGRPSGRNDSGCGATCELHRAETDGACASLHEVRGRRPDRRRARREGL